MLRKYRIFISFFLGLLFFLSIVRVGSANASPDPVLSPDFAAVDQYMTSQMKAARIPGAALAVVQGDEIVYLKGYGTAGSAGRAVTPQTPFMLASLVKPITALAVMQQVEAGQIDLDAPVQRYLPWFSTTDPAASAQITVRQLLTHTSGLPEAAGNEIPVKVDLTDQALEARVRRLSSVQLSSPPGDHYQYSSTNYDTLGLIVQTVSGQTFETYLQDHIFLPLNMHQSFTTAAEAEQHGLAQGYRSWVGFPAAFLLPHTRAYTPSGWGISSSAEDLAQLMLALLKEGQYQNTSALSLSPESLAAMQQPVVRSYNETSFTGLGWGLSTLSGVPVVSAGGDLMSYKTRLVLAPQQHLGLVVLMNMNSANVNSSYFELHRGVLSLLLGQQPPAITQPHFMLVFVAMLLILVVSVLFAIGIVWTLARLRQRAAQVPPRGWWRVLKGVGLPLVLTVAWTGILLLGIPSVQNRSLSFLILYTPDFGTLLVVSSVIACAWLLVRVIAFFQLFRFFSGLNWRRKRSTQPGPSQPAAGQ